MTAYVIVNYNVDNVDAYRAYQKGAVPALKVGSEAKLLAAGENSASLEGDPGNNTVVLAYESVERAREIYESGDYQAVLPERLGSTSKHFAVLVEGMG